MSQTTLTNGMLGSVFRTALNAMFGELYISQTTLQTAIATKEPAVAAGTVGQFYRGDKSWQTLDKTAVSLTNVDNTSDANKPVSTATQVALDAKANVSGLSYFATGTDASNLTGTVAASLIADGSLSIAKTSGLQSTLDSKQASGSYLASANNLSDVVSAVAAKDHITVQSAPIASAATVDLSTATGDYVKITGAAAITSFGTCVAGVERTVRFSAGIVLTYNATSLILPTAANITVTTGDSAVFRSEGSGNWRCISYLRGSGQALVAPSGTVTTTGTPSAGNLVAFSGASSVSNGDLAGDVTTSGALTTTIAASAVTLAKMANLAANSFLGNNTGSSATPIAMTAAQAKTLLAITESDVVNLTTDLATKAPLASPQFTGVSYYQQPTPTAVNATATLTIAQLLTLIITATSTAAVSLTLPTGTLTDAGILSGALATNEAFEWYIINLGSSSGAVTLVAGTGHTIVGGAVVAIATSARFLTRKTATNTFVTYRIA